MNLKVLVEIKNYEVVCQELYNIFVTESDLNKVTFSSLSEIFPGHEIKNSVESDNAVKFILRQIRTYVRTFHDFDTAEHPELIVKLYDTIETRISK